MVFFAAIIDGDLTPRNRSRRNVRFEPMEGGREADVRLAQGETIGAVCRELEVSEQTYYRWR